MAKVDYSAVGRRKKAVARVRLVAGDGKVTINKRDIDNYFGLETLKMTVRQPLTLTGTTSFDVLVNVCGGGVSGQAGAIRHGISRALCKADPELRAALIPITEVFPGHNIALPIPAPSFTTATYGYPC